MEIIEKGLDDVCTVCGGEEIDRGDGVRVCRDCGTVYRDDEYAALFAAYNALPEYVRIELTQAKSDLRKEVYSPSPDAEKITECCEKIRAASGNDRPTEFCETTLKSDAELDKYYDAFDPTACEYLVRELLLYAAETRRAVRPACKLIKRANSRGIKTDADIEARLREHAATLTVRYRLKTSCARFGSRVKSSAHKTASAIKNFFTAIGSGLKRFFTAIGHGLKKGFTAIGSGLKRFFTAVGSGLKRFFTAIGHSLKTFFVESGRRIKNLPRSTWFFLKKSYRNEPPTEKVCLGMSVAALSLCVLYECLELFLPSSPAAGAACRAMHIVAIVIEVLAAAYVFLCVAKGAKPREMYSVCIFMVAVGVATIPFSFINVRSSQYIIYGIYVVALAVWSVIYYGMCRKRNSVERSLIYLSFLFVCSSIAFIV